MVIIVAYVDIFGTLRDRVLGGQLRASPRLAFACERISCQRAHHDIFHRGTTFGTRMKHLRGPPIKSFYGGFNSQMPEPVQVNLPGRTQGHRPGIGGPQETLLGGGGFYSGLKTAKIWNRCGPGLRTIQDDIRHFC